MIHTSDLTGSSTEATKGSEEELSNSFVDLNMSKQSLSTFVGISRRLGVDIIPKEASDGNICTVEGNLEP